jgi:hypothetical protein
VLLEPGEGEFHGAVLSILLRVVRREVSEYGRLL